MRSSYRSLVVAVVLLGVVAMLVAVSVSVFVVVVIVVGGRGDSRLGLVTFADEGPRRRFSHRLVENPPALERAQMGHRFGDRGPPHESLDAIPRARPVHSFGNAPRGGDAVT